MSSITLSCADKNIQKAETYQTTKPPQWEKAARCWKKAWDSVGSSEPFAAAWLFQAAYCYAKTDLYDREEKVIKLIKQVKSRIEHIFWISGPGKRNECLLEICRLKATHDIHDSLYSQLRLFIIAGAEQEKDALQTVKEALRD